ncbi:MAG: ribonuclease H-like domain-containing protein [Candidatus Bipolaricaulota bacterium]|nr:ribonuclease H-like domain-containing protein [Candidatus Bipolaricaulota bacterium]MBS3792657.1 ribonuclease H-like domain-containing protein [Candidatus Bipolaricaulota bacterium]
MGKLERIAKKIGKVRKASEANLSGRGRNKNHSSPYESQHSIASQLKEDLLNEYSGKDFLSETEFERISTDYGETLHLREAVDKSLVTPDSSRPEILSDLKLVYGIGSVREKELKEKGYDTVEELVDHEKWGEKAETVQDLFRGELAGAYDLLRRWKSLSHPSFLRLSGLFEKKQFAIVDIETLGLSNQPVFLLGLAHTGNSGMVVHQFLAEDLDQELATLINFSEHLDERELILTYNGKNFDIPYIERRLAYYGQRKKFPHPHLDLYLFTRKVLGHRTRDCKLGTIEQSVLGVERDLDVPSSMVPDFYSAYREEKNPGPLLPILAHNRQDLLSLADLYRELIEEALHGNK